MHDLITSRLGRRLTAALATVCLAGAIAVPAGASTEPPTDAAPRLGLADVGPVPRDADRGTTPAAPATTPYRPSAVTGVADVYNDYCDDATGDAVDLAQARLIDGRASSGRIGLRVTGCERLSAATYGGGVQLVLLTLPAERLFVVDTFISGGQPVSQLLEIVGDTPVLVRNNVLEFAADGTARTDIAHADLGSPSRFAFEIVALEGDEATIGDTMPERGEPLGVWPESCDFEASGRYTATSDDPAATAAAAEAAGLSLDPTADRFAVRLFSDDQVARFAQLPGVTSVTPARTYRTAQTTPGPDQIGADAWWRQAAKVAAAPGNGAGIDIAIVDTGVDGTRAEFGGRVGAGYDGAADRPIPAGANSSRGLHGNHVAGIAAASQTVIGVAPAATIRPYQAFYFDACGDSVSVGRAIDAAVEAGVDIINLSLTQVGEEPPATDDLVRTATRRALADGITVVAAAGNTGMASANSYPASEVGVIAVGATGRDDRVASYSTSGPWMDLVAPGGQLGAAGTLDPELAIWSLSSVGLTPQVGTSMATPVVAGAAARYLAAGGDAADVRAALRASAVPVPGTTDPERIGAGALDVVALLGSIGDDLPTPPGPTPDPTPDGPLPPPDIGPICTGTDTTRFADIPDGNPHRFAAQCLARLSISSGFPDGTYRPAGGVTRGQMATFIVNLLEQQTGQALPLGSATFPDIAGGVHRDAIRKLASAGIVAGFPDDTYRPSDQVTRDQMATFLSRAIEREVGSLPRVRSPFGDIAGSPHEAAIDRIWYLGITSGNAQGDYAPRSTVRRDQMATFVARTFAFLEDSGTFTTP